MADWNRTGRRPRRRRHDPAELRRLIRRRESSGLSYAQLAKETGIPIGTLAWWSHRLRSEQERPTPSGSAGEFVELIPTGDGRPSEDIEVRLPGGIVVQVPAGIDRPAVVRLLSALLSC